MKNVTQKNTFKNILIQNIFVKKTIKKQNAVVDSSFWINIISLALVDYLLKYFELFSTEKVEQKILNFDKKLLYLSNDIIVYQTLKKNNLIKIKNPQKIIKKHIFLQKKSGELETISLANQEKTFVLIDDGKPYNFCINEKIKAINSVDFIIFLYKIKEINNKTAYYKITQLNGVIKEKYILNALEYLKVNLWKNQKL
jgi:hypothetical protein